MKVKFNQDPPTFAANWSRFFIFTHRTICFRHHSTISDACFLIGDSEIHRLAKHLAIELILAVFTITHTIADP